MSLSESAEFVLAIHEDTNANVTLFSDNAPIFALSEERLTRKKFQEGFPKQSLQQALSYAGIGLYQLEALVPGNRYHFLPRLPVDLFPAGEHDFFGPVHRGYLLYHHLLSKPNPLRSLIHAYNRAALKFRFPKVVACVDHHEAHAYSAYLTSGFDRATVITMDNVGDGFSAKVFQGRDGKCEFLYGVSALHSPGQFYGEITQALGFEHLMAGKVTGLAAFGNPAATYPIMKELFSLSPDRKRFVTPSLVSTRRRQDLFARLRAYSREDIAAGAQKRLEDVVSEFVATAVFEAGSSSVAVAGGTFANVKLNQKILHLPGVKAIFIHPAMTDQGISMGAGLQYLSLHNGLRPSRLDHVYLGLGYTEQEVGTALEQSGLVFKRSADIERTVADLLLAGKVVARFKGRMEYGPRALGNRSILYTTAEPSVNDWLNKKLKRSEFMPFAPATLAEYAPNCYLDYAGAEDPARFMTITFECSEAMKRWSPGVVHIDGTARPQVVHEQDNPSYYRLLRLYHEGSGIPSIINTSFNMHEEPIVCSPSDAIRAFIRSQLDYLAIENFLVYGRQL